MKIDLSSVYIKLSRKLESILRYQAPFDTGFLRSQVEVTYTKDGIEIGLGQAGYGTYLHTGTGQERAGKDPQQLMDKAWNPKPGKGTEGIKPRYWMNFSESVYEMMMDEIATAYAIQIEDNILNELNKL